MLIGKSLYVDYKCIIHPFRSIGKPYLQAKYTHRKRVLRLRKDLSGKNKEIISLL